MTSATMPVYGLGELAPDSFLVPFVMATQSPHEAEELEVVGVEPKPN